MSFMKKNKIMGCTSTFTFGRHHYILSCISRLAVPSVKRTQIKKMCIHTDTLVTWEFSPALCDGQNGLFCLCTKWSFQHQVAWTNVYDFSVLSICLNKKETKPSPSAAVKKYFCEFLKKNSTSCFKHLLSYNIQKDWEVNSTNE